MLVCLLGYEVVLCVCLLFFMLGICRLLYCACCSSVCFGRSLLLGELGVKCVVYWWVEGGGCVGVVGARRGCEDGYVI